MHPADVGDMIEPFNFFSFNHYTSQGKDISNLKVHPSNRGSFAI